MENTRQLLDSSAAGVFLLPSLVFLNTDTSLAAEDQLSEEGVSFNLCDYVALWNFFGITDFIIRL